MKLGIICEENVTGIIKEVMFQYRQFEYNLFVVDAETDIIEVAKQQEDHLDAWLICDRISLHALQRWGGVEKPIFAIPYGIDSFYKVLSELLNKNFRIDNVSIDTIASSNVATALNEVSIDFKKLNCLDESNQLTLQDYISFHKEAFQKSHTAMAFTSSDLVKKELAKMGITTFSILPARLAINNILNMLLSEGQIMRIAEGQVAVQVFDFDIYAKEYDYYSVDDLYAREITFMKVLIEYSKKINGSLKSAGQGRFFLFTTKGSLRDCTNNFTAIPDFPELNSIKKDICACGIGFGNSASQAELNAMVALRQGRETGFGSWFVITENKQIIGPLSAESFQTVDLYSENLIFASKQASLSVATLSKIEQLIKKSGTHNVSAQDLAMALHILPRSARRILQRLVEGGLAKEIGGESPGIKGRPKKVYQVTL